MPKMLKNVISGTVGNLTDGYDDTLANKSFRLELLIIYFLCKFATPY